MALKTMKAIESTNNLREKQRATKDHQSRLGQRARRGNASAEERGEEESEDEAGEGPEADVEGERKRTWRENDYYCYSAGLRIAPKRFCSAGFGIAPKSGVIGVSWHKVHCQWQVKVKVFGKYKCAHVTPKDDSPQEIERSRVAAVVKCKAMLIDSVRLENNMKCAFGHRCHRGQRLQRKRSLGANKGDAGRCRSFDSRR